MHIGSHVRFGRIVLLLVALLLLLPVSSAAEEGKKIVSIETSGNRYVENAAILFHVNSKVGDMLSRKQISRDVRALFETGYFADVHVEGFPTDGGLRIVYVVKENPLIAGFDIEGNEEVTKKDLKLKLTLKPGRVFSEASLRKDTNMIRKAYLKKGYYQVEVTVDKKARSDGRVDVTLKINEGEVTHIKRIHFVGNKAYSDAELRGELASKQSDLMSWFTDRDVFDRERFGADSQLLQQFYQNHGYLDMKIESSRLSLTPDKENFYLTFSIYEGPQYTIDQIEIQGDVIPSKEALQKAIGFEKGDTYSVSELRHAIQEMELIVGDEGYAFASVTPLFKRDVESRKLSITFDIEKGQEVYVERIEVTGNEKTIDEVVRRELRQSESERYSASNVKRSKERLERSRLYKDVRLNLEKGKQDDRVNMNVQVEEEKTGSLSFGIGYSQVEKTFFTVKHEERNFMGKGYTSNIQADVGGKTQNFNGSVSDPYFLGSDVRASINLTKQQTKTTDQAIYKQDNYGGGFSFAIPLAETLTYSIGYQYSHNKLSGIPATSTIALRAQEGLQTTGEVTTALYWDTRDRTFAATEGHMESLTLSAAGLGGTNKFYEYAFQSQSYFQVVEGFVLNPSLSFKSIAGYAGVDIPIYRRYSMGGIGSVRGFDSYGISLRDPTTAEAIGGDKQLSFSTNLFFPLPYMQTAGFRGVLFFDAGTVWGSVNTSVAGVPLNVTEKFSAAKIRTSTGVGVEWMSPIGPLSFAWGFPIHKVQGDLERNFEFTVGTSF